MLVKPSYSHAISAIQADALFILPADDLDRVVWQPGTTPIPKADIEAKHAELLAVYETKTYQLGREKRSEEGGYPEIGDQLDMIYHDQVDGTTTFKDAIKAIKDAHPKP